MVQVRPLKKSWDSVTNLYSETKRRSADVYVFCLFASTEPKVANPLDLKQWEFYILSTKVLNNCVPEQNFRHDFRLYTTTHGNLKILRGIAT